MEDRAERVIERPLETIKDGENDCDCRNDNRLNDSPDRLDNVGEEPLEGGTNSLQAAVECGDEVLVPPRDEPANSLANSVPYGANDVLA